MPYQLRFAPPVPKRPRPRIWPVFIPFAGCAKRCIFCAQSLQTGREPEPVHAILHRLDSELARELALGGKTRELAFYGGTFTSLPLEDQLACLDLAADYKKAGLISRVRCSTRPDALSGELLEILRKNGLDMLELGVQSFQDEILAASRPGYSGDEAEAACRLVLECGLDLGIQLMPGMPGMNHAQFRQDLLRTVRIKPSTLRLYPCLVIEGTRLARLWREGSYSPWELEESIPILAEALLLAEQSGIAVIRIGLAPEDGLQEAILAGPRHPALGSRVRARALYELARRKCARLPSPPRELTLPRRLSGEYAGHKGEILPLYAALGLCKNSIHLHDEDYCELI